MSGRDRWAWLRDPRVDEREVERVGVAAAGALARGDPLWPGRLATLVALALFLTHNTKPLTPRMKILMGIQGTAALVAVGVIIARAVNLLGWACWPVPWTPAVSAGPAEPAPHMTGRLVLYSVGW